MRFLIFSVLTFAISWGQAGQVIGTADRAIDGRSRTCQSQLDTAFAGSAYTLYAPEFSLIDETFSFNLKAKGLRCQKQGEQFGWKEVSVTEPAEYTVDGADGLLLVRSWLDSAELMVTDSDLNLITTQPLGGRTVEETVSFSAPLGKVLNPSEGGRWGRSGQAKFRLQVTLRGLSRYTVNGGPIQNLGLSTGGTFILQGEIRHTPQGNIISLTK